MIKNLVQLRQKYTIHHKNSHKIKVEDNQVLIRVVELQVKSSIFHNLYRVGGGFKIIGQQ